MIDWNTCPSVELNPELVSGAWVFRGTRVPLVALFENLEVGAIEPEAFYEALREATGLTLTNSQIETAWNAMLLDFPAERLEWLSQIKNKYNIYLFSVVHE